MRVLMLGWELPPHYVGGMGIVCEQLTRQMAKDGHDIEFILPFYADFGHVTHMKVTAAIDQDAETLMQSGGTYDSTRFEVTKNGQHIVTRSLYEQVHAYAQNVGRVVEYGQYDLIHAHDWLTLRAGIEAKRATGLPLFVHIHATEFDRAGGGYGNPKVREIEYMGLHIADHIFAVSQRTKDTLINEYFIPAEKITVTSNMMDIPADLVNEEHDTYVYLQKMRSLGYKVVVNAGRMTMQKGIYHLLQAARKVVDKQPKTLFLLAGGGEQIPELIEEAAALGLSGNVLFTGRIEGIGKQWRDAFRVADVFIMPSVSEPLGLVPYEAIAYGAPAIISNQSGIAEVLQNVLKVDYWDTEKMADQICAVLREPTLHDTLLDNAQSEVKKLTWAPVAQKIYDRYQTVLKTRKPVGAYV
ncbi:glycosyltransferase family 4 protein [Candidatus Saccharibacteria bacterium]|nr:glycosyltransferase family 4 protein [Candidatus Saccharibacteria bacterium]